MEKWYIRGYLHTNEIQSFENSAQTSVVVLKTGFCPFLFCLEIENIFSCSHHGFRLKQLLHFTYRYKDTNDSQD